MRASEAPLPDFLAAPKNLILQRKINEMIVVDGPCRIMVVNVSGSRVKLMVQADNGTTVHRQEIYELIKETKIEPEENDT